jgi:glycosyltransferase involved in cell wall biosynthesis
MLLGKRSTVWLKNVAPGSEPNPPKVSVLIPARNEERNIREALQSVLRQDYPHLEFIVVNDRSTDRTGAILAEMAAADRRLHVVELTELPDGWLGKNYALYRASEAASGEVLLFMDADIVMDPTVISRAVRHFCERQLDHLAIMPAVVMPGVLLRMFTSSFAIFFAAYARPWKANDPKSKAYIGIGAFNMVRASAYRAAGTHRAIAMRPDDDMKLGKLLKRQGCRQEMVVGAPLLRVEWYATLRETIDGLMKNSFAGVEYSVVASVAAGIAIFALHVWPFAALLVTHGAVWWLNLAIVLALLVGVAGSNRYHGLPRWYAIGHPLCSVLFVYIVWRSMTITLWNGGIRWRGTHYPLALLKANKVWQVAEKVPSDVILSEATDLSCDKAKN